MLDYYYENSALTFEGLAKTEENIEFLKEWLKNLDALETDVLQLNWVKGSTMNSYYHLLGDNAYPDDLTILVIEPGNVDLMKVALPRFEIGGRWFDDIVDNNERRKLEGLNG